MKRNGLTFLWLLCGFLHGADLIPADHAGVKTVLETNCFGCHGRAKTKGDVNLEALFAGGVNEHSLKTWRTAGSLVKLYQMPPDEAEHPLDEACRNTLVTWIDSLRYQGPADPGRVTIRRLNRREYGNTIRDLLGVELPVATLLPRDDVGNGFDNSADVLSMPPALFEKYNEAAQQAIDSVIQVGDIDVTIPVERWTVTVANEAKKADLNDGVLTLSEGGECSVIVYAPTAGRYRLKLDIGGNQVGKSPVQAMVLLDGQPLKTLKVTAKSTRSTALGTEELSAGSHRLSVVFQNPEQVDVGGTMTNRALLLGGLEINGPPARKASAQQIALLGEGPIKDSDPRALASEALARFLPRAWRRPVQNEEIDRLLAIYDQAITLGETWSGALRHPLQAALLSPNFLYRVEQDRPQDGITTLSDYEIANRLSYFLWASMPDEELFTAAAKGSLQKPDGRAAQVRRMLKDPKARALVDGFAGQWLMVSNLDDWQPDAAAYPGFDDRLRESMIAEPLEYFATVMAEDRDISEFLSSDWTVLDQRMAQHYGIAMNGAARQKVSTKGTSRGGVMTMAAILAVTSNPAHTSPPRRGKFVLEQMLNDPPPPPPPTAGGLPKAEGDAKHETVRQRLERHRSDPTCASCHKRLDPLGFAFEGFDVLGRERTRDSGSPIDTSGILPGGHQISGPEDLKRVLLDTRKREFLASFTVKMMTYAIGRGLNFRDEERVDTIVRDMQSNQNRFSTVILAIVESPQFLQRSQRTP